MNSRQRAELALQFGRKIAKLSRDRKKIQDRLEEVHWSDPGLKRDLNYYIEEITYQIGRAQRALEYVTRPLY